ncbi:MAG TPA: hypothetical protein VF832_07950 [Longimicrobiales bacterium]
MIVRTWRGAVRARDADAYREYLRRTGFAEYAGTPGHLGTLGLRRTAGDTTELLLLTLWRDAEAVRAFAGDDPDQAVFYPEDERFLVNADQRVGHFEPFFTEGDVLFALSNGASAPSPAAAPARRRRPGWWWRGWIAYAAGVAALHTGGVDFR